jgi:hypothetical protein
VTDRKKPGAAFWATVVLVAVLVGYPLSYGPFVWLDDRVSMPAWLHDFADWIYDPLVWFCITHPVPFGRVFDWYANLWR